MSYSHIFVCFRDTSPHLIKIYISNKYHVFRMRNPFEKMVNWLGVCRILWMSDICVLLILFLGCHWKWLSVDSCLLPIQSPSGRQLNNLAANYINIIHVLFMHFVTIKMLQGQTQSMPVKEWKTRVWRFYGFFSRTATIGRSVHNVT